eukprot:1137431-Pelagomonas_calceolata.AAC.3
MHLISYAVLINIGMERSAAKVFLHLNGMICGGNEATKARHSRKLCILVTHSAGMCSLPLYFKRTAAAAAAAAAAKVEEKRKQLQEARQQTYSASFSASTFCAELLWVPKSRPALPSTCSIKESWVTLATPTGLLPARAASCKG